MVRIHLTRETDVRLKEREERKWSHLHSNEGREDCSSDFPIVSNRSKQDSLHLQCHVDLSDPYNSEAGDSRENSDSPMNCSRDTWHWDTRVLLEEGRKAVSSDLLSYY